MLIVPLLFLHHINEFGSFEIIDPIVTYIGDAAVLTFNFISYGGSEGARMRWNCTEVYRRSAEKWRIIQTHWSLTQDGR